MTADLKQLKTGTTTVGIVCKDGIVMAADRRATAGFISQKDVRKVFPITDNIAVTIAGTVSEIQSIIRLIKAEIRLKELQTGRKITPREVANLLASILYYNIRKPSMIPGIAGFLLGGYDDKEGPILFELTPDGVITEREDYIADGSGMVFALGALESQYKKNMTIAQGITLAEDVVNAALQRDIYSGNGIIIMTITKEGAKTVIEKSINVGLH